MNDCFSSNDNNLIKRYLIWCYKTTKEDLDRIDRYFTQKIVDDFILENLFNTKEYLSSSGNEDYKRHVQSFENYKIEKFQKAQEKKFLDAGKNILTQDYSYIKNRLTSIEKAVIYFLGESELKRIHELYEQEMTQRILSARDHS